MDCGHPCHLGCLLVDSAVPGGENIPFSMTRQLNRSQGFPQITQQAHLHPMSGLLNVSPGAVPQRSPEGTLTCLPGPSVPELSWHLGSLSEYHRHLLEGGARNWENKTLQ